MFGEEVWSTLVQRGVYTCGIALSLAWFYGSFFSCSLVSVSYANLIHGSDSYWSIVVLALGIASALSNRFPLLRARGIGLILCALGCAAGILVIRYGYYSTDYHILFYWIGAILAGLGFGAIISEWIASLNLCEVGEIELIVPAAFLLSFVLYFLAFALKDAYAVWFLCACLLASATLLKALQNKSDFDLPESSTNSDTHLQHFDSASQTKDSKWRPFMLFFIAWFSFAVLRVFTAPNYPEERSLYYCVPFSIGLILSIIIVVLSIRYARQLDMPSIFKWVFALYPLGYAIDYAFQGNNLGGLLGYAVGCTSMLVMQICVAIVLPKRSRLASGSTRGSMTRFFLAQGFGVFAGVCCGKQLFAHYGPDWPVSVVLLIIFLLLGIGMITLPDRMPTGQHQSISLATPESNSDSKAKNSFDQFALQYSLSPRERDIAQLLVMGYSRPSIRDELFISLNTVGTHVKSIYAKVGVHSQSELLVVARHFGEDEAQPTQQ